MATLPTNRTPANTPAEHVSDHNTLHGLNNQLGNFTQQTGAPGSPASGDLWLDTDETAPSAVIAAQTAAAGSDVAMSSANTFYDVGSLSLSAGTYLISGTVHIFSTTGTWMTAKLWDGTTVYGATATYNTTINGGESLSIPMALVVLGSTTTVKLSAACDSTSGTIKTAAHVNGTGTTGKTSFLTAVKIA